jgi:hypothetical protein
LQEFITPPLDNGLPEGATTAVSDKHPGEYEFSAQTQQGSGADDGPYKHEGISQGYAFTVSSIRENLLGRTIFWADLDGDGRDELIWFVAAYAGSIRHLTASSLKLTMSL